MHVNALRFSDRDARQDKGLTVKWQQAEQELRMRQRGLPWLWKIEAILGKRAPEFDDWLLRAGLADAGFRLAGNTGLLPDFASRLIA